MDLINLIKQYKSDRMGLEKGKAIEASGIEQRKEFLSQYPIELIPNLTIEQYVLRNDNSFSHWLRYGLCDIASMGNAYPRVFGVYTTKDTGERILLSPSYQEFGPDYKKAFDSLKNEIVNFLEDIRQENYDNYEKYKKIDRRVRDMLMIVYFYDRFVPVCTNGKMNDCLNSLKVPIEKNTSMIYKNLALVEWKKNVPELADWSNHILLNFCSWLKDKNITISKEEICNNAFIEEAQKIEEEIASLNVDGASQKAIVNVRVNQGRFRTSLLKRYNKCCLCPCGVKDHALLIASHIKPWAESESKEKLDVNNGFLMCPNHDRLFDKGYITFDDDGKIMISDRLKETDRVFLNVDSRMYIELTEGNKKYLKFHREKVFIR